MCWETMCWENFCCCPSHTDEGTAVQKPPSGSAANGASSQPTQLSPPLASGQTNGVSNQPVKRPPPPPSGTPLRSETNGASKLPGANLEKPPVTAAAAAAAGGDFSSQESDNVDPAIKKDDRKSEEGKKGPKPNTKHPIHDTAADSRTNEKEHVKDVSSEKRGHDKSADRTRRQEGKPTSDHTQEAAAAAAAASSKPSSVRKNEAVGSQENTKRTGQEESRLSTVEPTREAAEYYQFPSVDSVGSQANHPAGRISQDQERRVSTKEPSEASPMPRNDQRRREAQFYQ